MDNWQIDFTGGEIKHGNAIFGGTENAGLTFHDGEGAIETFHKNVRGAVNPIPQDAL